MDRQMAGLIFDKKIGELNEKLVARKVNMTLSDEAHEWLLAKGFTREYGAREMDRVISSQLKPLLMREMLFGRLKSGGQVTVILADGQLKLDIHLSDNI